MTAPSGASRADAPPAPGAGAAPPSVRIESLAAGGDGVGHLADGMTVFVPRTAPGDLVALAAVRRHRRHARAAVERVVEPGPGRVAAPCAHFQRDGCGGCQWQHLSADVQRRSKARIVGDALRRLGRLPVEDPALVPSAAAFGYRATVTLTVQWTGQGPIAGFHRGEGAEVFPLDRCEIARDELNGLWRAIAPALPSLPRADDVRLRLRVAPDGALHVVVSGGRGAWTTARPLEAAAVAAGCPATIWWWPTGGAPRRVAGARGDRGALAFEQVNAGVAEALRASVLAAVPAAARRVLDLYGGTGEVAFALARARRDVVLVEMDRAAARRAQARAGAAPGRVKVVAARVEDAIGGLLPADAVVVNPPRAGLAPAVVAALAARPPGWLVYVSCDPATLARDLARLGARAERLALRCFDMFPQTSHVETLAVLRHGSVEGAGAPEDPSA